MGILTGIWLTLAGCGAPKAQVIMEAETAAADGTETQAGQELLGDPKERAEDVIYFDPSDLERPFGLNMLEWKTAEQRDFLVQEVIQIFYKLFDFISLNSCVSI